MTPANRITPAWAGKRRMGDAVQPVGKDYPRVGGEETIIHGGRLQLVGLPPRGRGRVEIDRSGRGRSRITPAWAGKRPHAPLWYPWAWDYPRVGGEESPSDPTPMGTRGLPPRGRGRGRKMRKVSMGWRITPAWAGKSRCSPILVNKPCGLPPRGRGRVWSVRLVHEPRGITPAWAGKRPQARGYTGRRRDYPRVGGEEVLLPSPIGLLLGLPPRGRGRESEKARARKGAGITPAWAGKREKDDRQPQ